MKFSQRVTKEFLDLMTEIQDTFLLQKKDTTSFIFNTFPDDKITGGDYYKGLEQSIERIKILEKLAELGAFKLEKIKENDSKLPELRYKLNLNKILFEKLYREFGDKIDPDKTVQGGLVFYLDNDGNFWHEPKDKFCYPMGKTSERLKILSYLVDNSGYQSPEILSEHLGGKNKQTIRTVARKIRDNIEKYLKVYGRKEVIDSKQDSGYRINPKHKVFKV